MCPNCPGRTKVSAADRAYFKKVMQTKTAFISEPLIGKTRKEPIVQVVAPILDANGDVQGVLVGVLGAVQGQCARTSKNGQGR